MQWNDNGKQDNTAIEFTAQYRPWNLSPSNNAMLMNIAQVPPLVWHQDTTRVSPPFLAQISNINTIMHNMYTLLTDLMNAHTYHLSPAL